jgi:hypothetical protein
VNIADRSAVLYEQTISTALEYLSNAAVHHMTKTAAYYIWRNKYPGEDGHALMDWLEAETDIHGLMKREATRQL